MPPHGNGGALGRPDDSQGSMGASKLHGIEFGRRKTHHGLASGKAGIASAGGIPAIGMESMGKRHP